MTRKTSLSGDELRGKEHIETLLGKRIPSSDANKYPRLADVDDEVVHDLRTLILESSRLPALLLLGFYVADDGATEEELYAFVEKVV